MAFVFAAHQRLWAPVSAALRDAYQVQHYPLGYAPGLDGLRGLMTLGIMVAHIRGALVPGAVAFMDVFFVMSGYFITGLLLRDLDRDGRINFLQFYRRRFARLLPAFALMVAVYLGFRLLFFPPFEAALVDAGMAFFYVMNWCRAFELPGVAYMSHTWSLAIEEQFYLLWPVALLFLVGRIGVGWRLVTAILSVALAVWMWRIWMTANGAPIARLYNGLDMRADALMIGCALAVSLKLLPADKMARLDPVLKKIAWPLVAFGFAVAAFGPDYRNTFYYYFGMTFLGALPGVLLIVVLIRPLDTPAHRIFERPELVFLGRIFYSMYLWHFPLFFIMKDLWGWPSGLRGIIGIPAVIVIATLSYTFLERRFMRRRAPESSAGALVGAARAG